MEETNMFALYSCNENENGRSNCDALSSSSFADRDNESTPVLLDNGEVMALTSKMDFLKTFKFELACVVERAEAAAITEAQRVQEIQERYDAERAMLKVQLQEKEETLLGKESAIRELKENFTAKVQELETLLGQKEALLEKSDTELQDLQAKISKLTSQVTQLESAIERAEAAATTEAQRVREIQERYDAEGAMLKVQLQEKEETLFGKESAIRELAGSFAVKVHELEDLLRAKEELLQSRGTELEDLQAKTNVSISQVTRLESVIEELRTAAANETQRAQESEERYAVLEARLREQEQSLEDSAVRGLREDFDAKVCELERELQVTDGLLQSREAELKQKELLLKAKEEDTVKLGEHMSAEIKKLTSELKEKKIALASYEKAHWCSLGRRNLWKRLFHGARLWASTASAASYQPEPHERPGVFTPSARDAGGREKSMEKNYMADPQHKEATKTESSSNYRKVVNLRS